jgi:sulfatase maturation enzyme AslB (radical SAM superfamily)
MPEVKRRERSTAVFYTCGTCNLKCHYCGIDKNPILVQIDKALEKSFEGDYYYNQLLKYFPDPCQLRRIETWGGEPFLKMERIHPLVNKVIEHYPYFDQMFSSTNFSYPEWPDKFFGLMKQFEAYAPRKFDYFLQLSLDGPTNINDFNRGEGVTEKCRKNFQALVNRLPVDLPSNVTLNIYFKPTLDNTSIKQLDTKEKIIEYYRFFEEWYAKLFDLKMSNLKPQLSVPNTAVPSPVTKEDGIAFAQLCKNCREIEKENKEVHYLRFYDAITPYAAFTQDCPHAHYSHGSCICGTGSFLLGFMPDGLISTCHEGFTHFYEEYKRAALNSTRVEDGATINFDKFVNEQGSKYCLTEKQYEEYEKYIDNFIKDGTTARLGNMAGLIMVLAMAGQIDSKYLDERNASEAAVFLQNHTSYCLKDNYNTTGSFITIPVGIPKLLLNGAKEYIQELDRDSKIDARGFGNNG